MKVKIFREGSAWLSATQVDNLEASMNAGLEQNPDIRVHHVLRLSQPTFGLSHLAVAVWYGQQAVPGPSVYVDGVISIG